MKNLRSFWKWFTTTRRGIGSFMLAMFGALLIAASMNAQNEWAGFITVILGALTVSAALDMAANEARAKEAAKWTTVLLSAIADDRNLQITVRNIQKGDEK